MEDEGGFEGFEGKEEGEGAFEGFEGKDEEGLERGQRGEGL